MAVGLALPIDKSCDAEISIKGLDTPDSDLVAKLNNWHLDVAENDNVEIGAKDDQNETLGFEIVNCGIVM